MGAIPGAITAGIGTALRTASPSIRVIRERRLIFCWAIASPEWAVLVKVRIEYTIALDPVLEAKVHTEIIWASRNAILEAVGNTNPSVVFLPNGDIQFYIARACCIFVSIFDPPGRINSGIDDAPIRNTFDVYAAEYQVAVQNARAKVAATPVRSGPRSQWLEMRIVPEA